MATTTTPSLKTLFLSSIPLSKPYSSFSTLTFTPNPNLKNPKLNLKLKSTPQQSSLYSSDQFELTLQNVDTVLDSVRPYLISDGGNVSVISVTNGVISLELQGACGNCASSTTTMKMGIEKVLKEKFGDAIKDICQVNGLVEESGVSVESVNRHLDALRPAIKNYGGSVEVLAIDGGDCVVKYIGPESIGSGIKAAIKERFPDIVNVQLTS